MFAPFLTTSRRLCAAIALSSLVSSGFAADVTWVAPSGGDWFAAANWSNSSLPTVSDWVFINSGTNIVSISGSTAKASSLYVGGWLDEGTLFVSSMLETQTGIVNGSVTVSGSSARWSSYGIDLGGASGPGNLTIQNGGQVSTSIFLAGYAVPSPQQTAILITGSNSRLTSRLGASLGSNAGSNSVTTLTVENGGVAELGDHTQFTSWAHAVVSGTGSLLTTGSLDIQTTNALGSNPPALLVQNGAKVVTGGASISFAGASGLTAIRITGTGSHWDNGGDINLANNTLLYVGQGAELSTKSLRGSGSVSLQNATLRGRGNDEQFLSGNSVTLFNEGATIDTGYFELGVESSIVGAGSLTKTGSGTLFLKTLQGYSGATTVREGTLKLATSDFNSEIYIGNTSGENASLKFVGTSATRKDVHLGYNGATGSAFIENGAQWYTAGNLLIGDSGTGSLTISNGLFYSTNQTILASGSNSSGDFHLEGSTASARTSSLLVGQGGVGKFFILGGATVISDLGNIGTASSGEGIALVSSSNSNWKSDILRVGQSGTGTLNIFEHGVVEAGTLSVGNGTSSRGTVHIRTGGWLSATGGYGSVAIGDQGEGSLEIDNGGIAQLASLIVGNLSGGGIVTITDTGSLLAISGQTTIGNAATGTLHISGGGGVYTTGDMVLGYEASSFGSTTVTGAGSALINGWASNLIVGRSGQGDFTVANGGTASFLTVAVAIQAGSYGNIRLNGGEEGSGILTTSSIHRGLGAEAKLLFDGGTLQISEMGDYHSVGLEVVLNGDGFIDLNGQSLAFGAAISGGGDFTLLSSGTAALYSTANTYSGTTFVEQATLRAERVRAFSASSSIVLGNTSSAVLDLNNYDQTIGSLGGGSGSLVLLGTATLTTGANNASSTFEGLLSGSGSLVKIGTGSMILSSSNSYSGGTQLKEGVVEFASRGLSTGAITFDGGTLRYGVDNTDDISTLGVTFAAGGATIDTNGGTVTFANSIGNGGTGSLTKSGSGKLILSGSNHFTGDLFINGGTLQAASRHALSDTVAVTLADQAGANFKVSDGSVTIGSLSGGGANGGDVTLASTGYLFSGSNNATTTFAGRFHSEGGIDGGAFYKTGTGTLTLTGGGTMGQSLAVQGGKLVLSGSGADFSSGNIAVINGLIEVRNGAHLSTSYNGGIGTTAEQTGIMLVTGTGSLWEDFAYHISVSVYGNGVLTIANGGRVVQASGTGTLTLGAATYTGTLNIGDDVAPSTAGTIGVAVVAGGGARGIVNFNQTDSTAFSARLTGNLDVNQRGPGVTTLTGSSEFSGALNVNNGTLRISAGGSVTNSVTSGIGDGGSPAAVIVSGTGSFWNLSSDIFLGSFGDGSLTIENGGSVSDTFALLGRPGGSGTVVVTGSGSQWNNSQGLIVGYQGNGSLTISHGAKVTNFDAIVGGQANASGTASVTGTGSTWTSSSRFDLGESGGGVLTIADGGVVNVGLGSGTMTIGKSGTASGTLNIGAEAGSSAIAAGTLNAARIDGGSGSGSKIVNFNHTSLLTFNPTLTGALTVEHRSGTTILDAVNTYTGTTTVSGGVLLINGSIASNTVVQNGGTLGGSGVIGGAVTVQSGGTLSPGNSPGQLTLLSDLTLSSGAFLRMEFGGKEAGQYDQLDVRGLFTAGGTLSLRILDGYQAAKGDTFTLFNGATPGFDLGSFTVSTNLENGLYWDTSALASLGVVSIVPEPSIYALGITAFLAASLFFRKRRTAA